MPINMSYCRFQNTSSAMKECLNALEDGEGLSREEQRAFQQLHRMAQRLVDDYEEDELFPEEDEDQDE